MLITDSLPLEAVDIVVTSLREARTEHVHYDAVLTVEDSDMEGGLRIIGSCRPVQLVLRFDDKDFDDGKSPVVREEHVRAALDFGRRHVGKRLLIHCHAGQCRSPALALAVIADRMGHGRETEAVAALLQIRSTAAPNLLVLDLADRILGRGGSLKAAWMRHEANDRKIGGIRLLRQVAEGKSVGSFILP